MRLLHSTRFILLLCLVGGVAFDQKGHAQTSTDTQKIVGGMIEALGGKTFVDVKEIQTNGRFFTFRRGDLASSDIYTDYVKFPDMERTEFGKEKQKTIRINKGSQGWVIGGKTGKEVEPQSGIETEDFLLTLKTSFDYVTRFLLNAPKTTLLATGSEIVDFRRSDVVEVRDAAKNLVRLFVDRETHLPVRMQVRRANESVLYEEAYGNWHRFGGVMTPLFITRFKDSVKTMEIRAEAVTYNSGLSDSLFAPPASK